MSVRPYRRIAMLVCLWVLPFLGIAARANADTVTLQWDPNTESGITGYTIAYGTRSGVYDSSVDVGNTTTYTLTLTTPGTYYIAVSARSADGVSDYSAEVTTTVAGSGPAANPVSNTLLAIDNPSVSQVVPSDIFLTGWAADLGATSGSGVDAIHVYVYPNPGSGAAPILIGAAAYGTARPDVAAVIGGQFVNCGYSLPIVGLAPGRYILAAFAHSTVTNTFTIARAMPITVAPVVPPGARLFIDTPRTGADIPGALMVAGWAADQRATTGPGVDAVDVWAYPAPGSGRLPIFLARANYGGNRADVGALLGARFRPTGFSMTIVSLPAGVYDVVAFPRSTVSGVFENPQIVRVTIRPSVLVVVDTPVNGGTESGTFRIDGWGLDRRATANNGIDALHVYAFRNPGSGAEPVFLGATAPGLSRPDVAAAFGAQFADAGYSLTVSNLAPGVYDVVVFARSRLTGQFENASVVRVTVQ
jgi:Fibronectin type III domain